LGRHWALRRAGFQQLENVKPVARLLLDRVPPLIPLWGYRLGENITGALIFYGVKFQAVDTLEADAAAVKRPPAHPAARCLQARTL
jgi:hypothetical protein